MASQDTVERWRSNDNLDYLHKTGQLHWNNWGDTVVDRCECGGVLRKANYPDDLHWQVCEHCGERTKQEWYRRRTNEENHS